MLISTCSRLLWCTSGSDFEKEDRILWVVK